MATYPELASMLETQHSLLLQRRPGQRILLTVHNPRYLLESAGGLAPLLLLAQHAAGGEGDSKQHAVQPVQMLALAPCSASYTSTLFGAWAADMARWMPGWDAPTGKAAKPEVPWIVPLVPWAPANETKGGKGLASKGEGEYRGPLAHFCIQVGGGQAGAEWGGQVWAVNAQCEQGAAGLRHALVHDPLSRHAVYVNSVHPLFVNRAAGQH